MTVKVVRVASNEEDLKLQVQKLELNDGDVILIKVNKPISDGVANNLSDSFKKAIGEKKVHAMLIEEPIDVSKLNEDDMRELGWVKANPFIQVSRHPYIIKSHSKRDAEGIARYKGLKHKEWRYFPSGISGGIDGLRTTKDRLIGDFTDKEIMYLTSGTELDSPSDGQNDALETS